MLYAVALMMIFSVSATTAQQCIFQENTGHGRGSKFSVYSVSKEECCDKCAANARCASSVFIPHHSKCWFWSTRDLLRSPLRDEYGSVACTLHQRVSDLQPLLATKTDTKPQMASSSSAEGGEKVATIQATPLDPAWPCTQSSSGLDRMGNITIAYWPRMMDMTADFKDNSYLACRNNPLADPEKQRVPLPQSIRALSDFAAGISMSLQVMVMGDSIGIQIFNWLEEALGMLAPVPHITSPEGRTRPRPSPNRTVERYCGGSTHISTAVSRPTRGGGTLVGWRITGMLQRKRRNKAPPNSPGGGWLSADVDIVVNELCSAGNRSQVQCMYCLDAVVFRPPVGWISMNAVNHDSLGETVQLAYELFRARTVIFLTVPLNNNMGPADVGGNWTALNDRIRSYTRNYRPHGPDSVQIVYFGDFAALTHDIALHNAAIMGYSEADAFRIQVEGPKGLKSFAATVCGEQPSFQQGSNKCKHNWVSLDGMHWCPQSVAGRLAMGISCLLQCATTKKGGAESLDKELDCSVPLDTNTIRYKSKRICQDRCNVEFFSLSSKSCFNNQLLDRKRDERR